MRGVTSEEVWWSRRGEACFGKQAVESTQLLSFLSKRSVLNTGKSANGSLAHCGLNRLNNSTDSMNPGTRPADPRGYS